MEITEKRLANLDATRFWAFLSVFLLHILSVPEFKYHPQLKQFFDAHINTFQLGVDYFFTLSGFIITWTILNEYQSSGNFSLKNFYRKRALRIFPLYFLIFMIIYVSHFFTNQLYTLPPAWHFALTLNFYLADNPILFLPFAAICWTIAVELQFYLFFGFCIKYLKKYFTEICLSMILVSILFRAMAQSNSQLIYFSSFSYLSYFSMGAMAARLAINKSAFIEKIKNLSFGFILIFYLVIFINILFYSVWYNSGVLLVFEKIIFGLFFCFVILEQVYANNSLIKLGGNGNINFLGKISFGLYCFHTIALSIFSKIAIAFELNSKLELLMMNPLFIFGITVLLAWLSFTFLEKRFLNYKNNL